MGGGFPLGTTALLGGPPGRGKSTLALGIAAYFPSTLYVATEESPEQVRERADRVLTPEDLQRIIVFAGRGCPNITDALEGADGSSLVVLDSLPGLVGDVARNADAAVLALRNLKDYAIEHLACVLVIDHATKDDLFAGRLTLQHEVDTTVSLEDHDDEPEGRLLRTVKNRHGPSGYVTELHLGSTGLSVVGTHPKSSENDDPTERPTLPPPLEGGA